MEKICDERHKGIADKLKTAETRLNNHSERIDKLEQNNVRMEERLDNLIKQLSSLNTIMRWFVGLLVGAFVSFFFYAVQQKLF